jgi:hypothetical protein
VPPGAGAQGVEDEQAAPSTAFVGLGSAVRRPASRVLHLDAGPVVVGVESHTHRVAGFGAISHGVRDQLARHEDDAVEVVIRCARNVVTDVLTCEITGGFGGLRLATE